MGVPLVSVCLITYNHVKFIRQALDGVISQKVNFEWELIIADDDSKDGTRDILLDYANRYRSTIRLLLQEKNVGAARNWLDLIISARGKYIAYLEGDDFWLNENRLSKLVSFLEDNRGYTAVFHNANVIMDNTISHARLPNYNSWETERDLSIIDLIDSGIHCPIASVSLIFRRKSISDEEIAEISMLGFGDRPLEILLAYRGKIRYFPEAMAVYRKNTQSATAKFNWFKFEKDYEDVFLFVNRKLNFEFDERINLQLKGIYVTAAHQYFGLKMYQNFKESFYKIRKFTTPSDFFTSTFVKLYTKYLLALLLR